MVAFVFRVKGPRQYYFLFHIYFPQSFVFSSLFIFLILSNIKNFLNHVIILYFGREDLILHFRYLAGAFRFCDLGSYN
jgi:hypothetical protein